MKTPREIGHDISGCDGRSSDGCSTACDIATVAIAQARAEGYKIGVRARDEWSVDRDAAGARDRALEQLGINQDTLVRVKL